MEAASANENESKNDAKDKQVAEMKSKIHQSRKPPIPLFRPSLSLKDKSNTSKSTSSKAVSSQHLNKRKVAAPGDTKTTTKIEAKDKLPLKAESNESQRTHNKKVTPKDSKTMKLQLRSFKKEKTLIIVKIPNPCTLQHLKKLVSQKLPSTSNSLDTLHLSLNQKDELITKSPKDSIQSIGITSDDIVYFTTNPNGFCTNDFISQMSDDVLVMILSFLSIKEAVITSTLSTRWKLIWRHLIQLNFHDTQTFDDPVSFDFECKKYINQVNSVIQSYNHPVIKDFRIRYCLRDEYQSVIDEWLQFAVNKKVEFLELDLSVGCRFVGGIDDDFLMGDIKLNLFNTDVELVSLKKLILDGVKLNDTIFHKILSHSPNLERLSIYCPYSIRHIRVGGRALKLKHFEIWNNTSIYLSDFDLESFTYVGPSVDLSFSCLRKLKKLNLGEVNWWLDGDVVPGLLLSCCASSLHSLSIRVKHGKQCSWPNQFCELPNVKQLRLAFTCYKRNCLVDLAHIVNAFPSLESFKLEIHCTSAFVKRPTRDDINPTHQQLKFFEIVGYQGRKCDFELVEYIIEVAVVLKKIVIRILKDDCTDEKAARLSAKHLVRRLESIVAQRVELVVV